MLGVLSLARYVSWSWYGSSLRSTHRLYSQQPTGRQLVAEQRKFTFIGILTADFRMHYIIIILSWTWRVSMLCWGCIYCVKSRAGKWRRMMVIRVEYVGSVFVRSAPWARDQWIWAGYGKATSTGLSLGWPWTGRQGWKIERFYLKVWPTWISPAHCTSPYIVNTVEPHYLIKLH